MPATLLSLPDVLVQSVMHMLHAPDILRLARCSRHLLSRAGNAFAWHHCPPCPLNSDRLARFTVNRSPHLRWLPLAVEWISNSPSAASADQLIAFAESMCVNELDLKTASVELIVRLLTAPSLQGVLTLTVPADSAGVIVAVSAMPRLHSLHLVRPSVSVDYSLLRLAPALTRLHFVHSWLMPTVAVIPHIRSLVIEWPQFDNEHPFAFGPALSSQLESLTLIYWPANQVRSITPDHLATAFAALTNLRSLSLQRFYECDHVLAQLHRAQRLEHVTVECGRWLPTDPVLIACLRSTPRLHCKIFSNRANMAQDLRAATREFPDRLVLVVED